MNRRLVTWSVLLTLPALILCAGSVWFYTAQIPRLVSSERSAVTREYRAVAMDLWQSPESAEERSARPAGWRQVGRVGRNFRKRRAVPWGHNPEGEGEVVWIADENDPKSILRRVVTPVETIDIARLFILAFASGLVVVFGLTAFSIGCFVRYAKDRDDFIRATVHDLTTPLVALRRLVGSDPAEAARATERMVRLVRNLSDFLALGGRRPALVKTTFDLRRAYAEAYAVLADDFRWQFEGADVAVEGPDTLMVEADETMTVQILWNLLANELKYAAPYGGVRVRFETAGPHARVLFIDEGKGLTAGERRRLFRRYYRAKSIQTSGKGGFGIGLCTARAFARAMGGELAVAANHPHGCVFTLTLRRQI